MYSYEVSLEICNNGSKMIVRTIVQAISPIQARALAQSMAGPGGRVIVGPYPVQQ